MDTPSRHDAIDAARRRAGLTVEQLWLRYLALTGDADLLEVDAYLHGLIRLDPSHESKLSHAAWESQAELNPHRPGASRGEYLGVVLAELLGTTTPGSRTHQPGGHDTRAEPDQPDHPGPVTASGVLGFDHQEGPDRSLEDRSRGAEQQPWHLSGRDAEVAGRIARTEAGLAPNAAYIGGTDTAADNALQQAAAAYDRAAAAHDGSARAHRAAADLADRVSDHRRAQEHRAAADIDEQAAISDRAAADAHRSHPRRQP